MHVVVVLHFPLSICVCSSCFFFGGFGFACLVRPGSNFCTICMIFLHAFSFFSPACSEKGLPPRPPKRTTSTLSRGGEAPASPASGFGSPSSAADSDRGDRRSSSSRRQRHVSASSQSSSGMATDDPTSSALSPSPRSTPKSPRFFSKSPCGFYFSFFLSFFYSLILDLP